MTVQRSVTGPAAEFNEDSPCRAVSAIGLMSGTSLGRRRRRADRDRRRAHRRVRADRLSRLYARPSGRCCAARWQPPRNLARPRPTRPGVLAEAEALVTRRPCRGGRDVPGGATALSASDDRRDRLPRPDRAAPAGAPADGADRRRPRARARGSASRWSTIFAPPTSRRAGRARRWCRCFIARWRAGSIAPRPVAVLNIGGVANVTFIDGDDDSIACDTGPGNALIDDFMRRAPARRSTTTGEPAAAGTRRRGGVARLLAHPFFARPPPKSLDRNAFRTGWRSSGRSPNVDRGRRRDAHRAHRRGGRARRAAAAARAGTLDRRRRRRAQSDADADARRAARACAGRDRRRGRLVGAMRSRRRPSPIWRCARLRGLPITFPGDDRRAEPMTGGSYMADASRPLAAMPGLAYAGAAACVLGRLQAACRDRRRPSASAGRSCRRRNGWRRGRPSGRSRCPSGS